MEDPEKGNEPSSAEKTGIEVVPPPFNLLRAMTCGEVRNVLANGKIACDMPGRFDVPAPSERKCLPDQEMFVRASKTPPMRDILNVFHNLCARLGVEREMLFSSDAEVSKAEILTRFKALSPDFFPKPKNDEVKGSDGPPSLMYGRSGMFRGRRLPAPHLPLTNEKPTPDPALQYAVLPPWRVSDDVLMDDAKIVELYHFTLKKVFDAYQHLAGIVLDDGDNFLASPGRLKVSPATARAFFTRSGPVLDVSDCYRGILPQDASVHANFLSPHGFFIRDPLTAFLINIQNPQLMDAESPGQILGNMGVTKAGLSGFLCIKGDGRKTGRLFFDPAEHPDPFFSLGVVLGKASSVSQAGVVRAEVASTQAKAA